MFPGRFSAAGELSFRYAFLLRGDSLPEAGGSACIAPFLVDPLTMRAILQRVSSASVRVDDQIVGQIAEGFLVLLGIAADDTVDDVTYLAGKICGLRVFEDDEGKMNRSIDEVGGAMLIVSQFTLYGDCRKGRRPSFIEAARPEVALPLYERFLDEVRGYGIHVETGRFQAHMEVSLVNDGPVTMMLDSRKAF